MHLFKNFFEKNVGKYYILKQIHSFFRKNTNKIYLPVVSRLNFEAWYRVKIVLVQVD